MSCGSTSTQSVCPAVTTDISGNVYAAGWIRTSEVTTADFGNSVTLSLGAGTVTCFLVKYNPSGTPQWAAVIRTAASTVTDMSNLELCTDSSNYVTVIDTLNNSFGVVSYNFV